MRLPYPGILVPSPNPWPCCVRCIARSEESYQKQGPLARVLPHIFQYKNDLFSRKFLASDPESPLRAGTPPPTHHITLYAPICLSMLYSALQVLLISRRSQNRLGERWRSLRLSLMRIWGKFIVVPTLRILKPTIRDSRVAQKLSAQAREYVRAVCLGLLAAQSGFTATEDILALAKNMNGTTAEERNDYLVGTLELADKAYTQASETFQVFRNIRATMFAVSYLLWIFLSFPITVLKN